MADIMSRTRYDLLQMLSSMERLFDGSGLETEEGTLALDIYEQDNALVVEASVPGFSREDIDVQLHQGLLSIVASRPAQRDVADSGRRYYRQERPTGAWTRRIALPGVVHDADVAAQMKDGVLILRIPIPAAARPRRIEIGAGVEATTSSAATTHQGVMGGESNYQAPEPVGAALN
ncbi:MAG: Hsp20/alpha crystallin family protein [Dehalococcoidia bacterium]